MASKLKSKKSSKGNASKKGVATFLPTVLVKLIFAAILIVLLIWFGSKIWSAIFPSGEKNSVQSFDTLYYLLEAKAAATTHYDSTKINLYLEDNYQIMFFDKNDRWYCNKDTSGLNGKAANIGLNGEFVLKPDACKSQSCICLYKDAPYADSTASPSKKNDNVVKCTIFKNNINMKDFDMNGNDCTRLSGKFFNLIVAEKVLGGMNQEIHVWQDNETNRQIDYTEKQPVCLAGSDPLCLTPSPKKHDEFLFGLDVLNRCKQQSPPIVTVSAQCVFDDTLNKCNLKCQGPGLDCDNGVTSCSDYQKYRNDGSMTAQYMSKDSAGYWACENDKAVCNKGTNGCKAQAKEYLLCDQGIKACDDYFNKIDVSVKTACNLVKKTNYDKGTVLSFTQVDFVVTSGSTKQTTNCQQFLSQTIFKQILPGYTLNSLINHDAFLADNLMKDKCGIIKAGEEYLVVNAAESDCAKAIDAHFVQIYDCVDNTAKATT